MTDNPRRWHEYQLCRLPECNSPLTIVVPPGQNLVARGIVILSVGPRVERCVGKKLAAIIAMRGLPQSQTITGAKHRLFALDAIPRHRIRFQIVDQRRPGTVSTTGTDDRHLKISLVVGLTKDLFACQLVAPITADGFLRERFVDQHLRWYFHTIRTHGRTEDKLLAASAESADITGRLLGRETDHVDDRVEARRREPSLEVHDLVAVASEPFHLNGQGVL